MGLVIVFSASLGSPVNIYCQYCNKGTLFWGLVTLQGKIESNTGKKGTTGLPRSRVEGSLKPRAAPASCAEEAQPIAHNKRTKMGSRANLTHVRILRHGVVLKVLSPL